MGKLPDRLPRSRMSWHTFPLRIQNWSLEDSRVLETRRVSSVVDKISLAVECESDLPPGWEVDL